jgi:TPP-dependent pyruvate/acetoin dehydrogenase alpha subunit/nucleoside-diphosphate-sugar epimerase
MKIHPTFVRQKVKGLTVLDPDIRIFVAGGETLIGTAILRALTRRGIRTLWGGPGNGPDPASPDQLDAFFRRHRPQWVFHAAGLSGGIAENIARPASLASHNLLCTVHLFEAARRHGALRLVYFASSCCYPRQCPQPMRVDDLFTGPAEPTNEAYAVAKLAGIALSRAWRAEHDADFRVALPANAYGPGDDFSTESSHVIPALIRRFHQAKVEGLPAVLLWGTGAARRQFIFADDLAEASLALMAADSAPPVVNLAADGEITIRDLAEVVRFVVGYTGEIHWDATRPDGAPAKVLESSAIRALGWQPAVSLPEGIARTYDAWRKSLVAQPASSQLPQKARTSSPLSPATPATPQISDSPSLDERLYRSLFRIRRVEEEIARVYPTDRIMSPVHLSIGQEAVSVAVCEALRPGDVVFGSYRSHALFLAKGGDLKGMIAELYGKAAGVAKGKAGSMHLVDPAAGVMGASAVVGTTIPHAAGYALACRIRGEPRVTACFFGEGAVEEGVFHETLNFASLKKLPVLFVCENNGYAIHSRQSDRQATADVCALARAHGLPAESFDEMDVYRLLARAAQAAEEMRAEKSGPVFFECRCYRWMEHVGPREDFDSGYRSQSEAEPWIAADPLKSVASHLPEDTVRRIEKEVEEEIDEAFEFAEASPFPPPSELYADLYGQPAR